MGTNGKPVPIKLSKAARDKLKDKSINLEMFLKGDNLDSSYGMTLVALIALDHEIKKGIPDTIKELHEASICVRVVSGDDMQCSIKHATQAGIIKNTAEANEKFKVMTGQELKDIC